MYKRVLVANRGLIQAACVRAIKGLDAEAVALCEEGDFNQVGVREASRAYVISSNKKSSPYLDIEQIVNAAVECKADAVHPGYGFLASSTELNKKLSDRGIAFITSTKLTKGRSSGENKKFLNEAAIKAGIAVLPHSEVFSDISKLLEEAKNVGYPLMVKAAGAASGRCIREARNPAELQTAIDSVLHQCERFGYEKDLYLEKTLTHPHIISFPILRDKNGNHVILPELECSVQFRFRKILVESPSPLLSKECRGRILSMLPAFIDNLGLVGHIDVEFFVAENDVYLLDVKESIQHFHGVTNLLTGVDVLREQIRLHSGEPLLLRKDSIRTDGSVIAVNIEAMDPYNKFSPSPGKIERMFIPYGEGVVVQSPFVSGDTISSNYESVLAKVMVYSSTRAKAISNMEAALSNFRIEGISTTLPFLRGILKHPDFLNLKWTGMHLNYESRVSEILENINSREEEEQAALIAALALSTDSNASTIMANAEHGGFLWAMFRGNRKLQ
ncbi:MAG: ATP-grasp domain-containing protein [Fibromonadaceae bacterium]|jgi:acetyl/propionyl-CoA carboxylase alpha subunit|nr:ATP-grasp domain-containing protein [Fibromonadaceae bacterium]